MIKVHYPGTPFEKDEFHKAVAVGTASFGYSTPNSNIKLVLAEYQLTPVRELEVRETEIGIDIKIKDNQTEHHLSFRGDYVIVWAK